MEKKMDPAKAAPAALAPSASETGVRRIRCTPQNAAHLQRALAHSAPQVLQVVRSLHAAGLMAGMRGVSVVLQGDEARLARGLDVLLPQPTTQQGGGE